MSKRISHAIDIMVFIIFVKEVIEVGMNVYTMYKSVETKDIDFESSKPETERNLESRVVFDVVEEKTPTIFNWYTSAKPLKFKAFRRPFNNNIIKPFPDVYESFDEISVIQTEYIDVSKIQEVVVPVIREDAERKEFCKKPTLFSSEYTRNKRDK